MTGVIMSRLRRLFHDDEPVNRSEPVAVTRTREELAQYREAKIKLVKKLDLDRTGFVLGDAALARLDRRFLPEDKGAITDD
jgi:hypothetical protein